ncbi:hypothetical protein TRICI_005600 [Trichomonascus ciferrii]|uniref:CAF17 C-terminal domain-containing protein n=1 Tax=Trichomonascus ciferrii TaxID=44093 RepID=A0A642URU9_9ASCO|nr:hypothetical protein TRICI_005600 [Trichomonascus ciferrii]
MVVGKDGRSFITMHFDRMIGARSWIRSGIKGIRRYTTAAAPPAPPLRGYTQLDRSLVSVAGPEATKFLNGIITNRLTQNDDHDLYGFYAGFLNAKGRVMADSFIYPAHNSTLLEGEIPEKYAGEPAYVVDCDSQIASTLLSMLKMFKLRAKVHISPLDSEKYKLWTVWDDTEITDELPLDFRNRSVFKPYVPDLVGATDNRASVDGRFGLRLVLPNQKTPLDVLSDAYVHAGEIEHSDIPSHDVRRMLFGIPEGVNEFIPEKSLPLENCMDYMGGVDFNKGCYVGQELTIRSYHHGVVRKRVIPVSLSLDGENYADQQLEYNPDEPLLSLINTSTCLPGSSIVDITGSISAGQKPLAPSPFGGATSSSSAPKSSGNILAAVGNVGLALVRLEHFANLDAVFAIQVPNAHDNTTRNVYVKGFQPFWWPQPEE